MKQTQHWLVLLNYTYIAIFGVKTDFDSYSISFTKYWKNMLIILLCKINDKHNIVITYITSQLQQVFFLTTGCLG